MQLNPSRNINLVDFLTWFIVILPAFFAGFLILKYSVNVPYWDQWATPGFQIEKVIGGNLGISDLIDQHNESRKFFPKILFISLAYFTHWNVRYEMAITFLLACLVSWNIGRLLRITIPTISIFSRGLLLFISNSLVFSLMQWENWIWGIQLITFIPIACITSGLVFLYSERSFLEKLLFLSLLSSIATFSFANGILCWVTLFPAFVFYFLISDKSVFTLQNRYFIYLFIPLLVFISNVLIYFNDYQKPEHHPALSEAVVRPIDALMYFSTFLGSPLGFFDQLASQTFGMFALILTVICLIYIIFAYSGNRSTLIPWLTIAGYSIVSGLITTIGRVGFGIDQALGSRYVTFSTYAIVGLIYVSALILQDVKKHRSYLAFLLDKLSYVVLGICLVTYLVGTATSAKVMAAQQNNRQYARSCLSFSNILLDEECLKSLFPHPDILLRVANNLSEAGWIDIDIVGIEDKERILLAQSNDSKLYGHFDDLERDAGGTNYAKGWAILPSRLSNADAVILAYKEEESYIPFGLAKVYVERKDVADFLNDRRYKQSGWYFSFSDSSLPTQIRPLEISAWAFDSETGEGFLLQGIHFIG